MREQSDATLLPPLSDNIHGLLSSAGDGEFRSPFSSRLWSVRASVQRGFEALYTVQVCEHCFESHRCRIVLETSKFLIFAIEIVVLHLHFFKNQRYYLFSVA